MPASVQSGQLAAPAESAVSVTQPQWTSVRRGGEGQPPIECLGEIDEQVPSLVFRRQDEERGCIRFRLERCTGVYRGWQLRGAARRTLERGAFPREVDLAVLAGCYNNTYDYYTSRLSGWTFCPSTRMDLLSDEAWSRTLVVSFPAAAHGRKQQDALMYLQRHSQGTYDSVYLHVLGVIGDKDYSSDAEFLVATDAWRTALR